MKQALVGEKVSFDDWHARLGHPQYRTVSSIIRHHALPSSSVSTSTICSSLHLGKLSRIPLALVDHHSKLPFEIVYSDVWGPAPMSSHLGHRYFVLFIDDFTRYTWIYFLKNKSEVYSSFLNFEAFIHRQFNSTIKAFHSDWGGEYQKLNVYFKNKGIVHRLACPYTHEQNGVAERKIRHVVDTGLTILAHSHVPLKFWNYAFETSISLINMLPTPVLQNKCPFQLLFHKSPSYHDLKIFGCAIFPWLRPYNKNKFNFRTKMCVFLGKSTSHYGFHCLDIDSGRVYIARHAKFDESTFPFNRHKLPFVPVSHLSSSPWMTMSIQSHAHSNSEAGMSLSPLSTSSNPLSTSSLSPTQQLSTHPLLSPSSSTSPDTLPNSTSPNTDLNPDAALFPTHTTTDSYTTRTHPMVLRPSTLAKKQFHLTTKSSSKTNFLELEPQTFNQANHYNEWKKAMQEEICALLDNKTWTLVPRPPDKNVVSNKWIYRIKRLSNGQVERFKARLVAKGFTQQSGLDYTETFSPVVKATTIRILLALATMNNWPIKQLDVSNAFLHGDLHNEIYMEQPPGFIDSAHPSFVCRLHKSLYGLKQAPREWFHRLSQFLHQFGFNPSKADTSLFIYRVGTDIMFLLCYVDDLVVMGSTSSLVHRFIRAIQSEFPVRDLGDLHFFLGIEANRLPNGLLLTQSRYISDLLKRTGMEDAKACSSPMVVAPTLSKTMGTSLSDGQPYRQVVGALQYLSMTRPDIAFSVNKLCQFMHAPTDEHWKAVKRLLRYLKGTMSYGLFFDKACSLQLQCFTDSDWGGCPDDRRSTSGFGIFLGNCLVSWMAKKQPTIARSSSESEYKSIANATAEVLWIKSLLAEIGYPCSSKILLWCDNIGAVYLTANPIFHYSNCCSHLYLFVITVNATKTLSLSKINFPHWLCT